MENIAKSSFLIRKKMNRSKSGSGMKIMNRNLHRRSKSGNIINPRSSQNSFWRNSRAFSKLSKRNTKIDFMSKSNPGPFIKYSRKATSRLEVLDLDKWEFLHRNSKHFYSY